MARDKGPKDREWTEKDLKKEAEKYKKEDPSNKQRDEQNIKRAIERYQKGERA
jgi:hypothetical protein